MRVKGTIGLRFPKREGVSKVSGKAWVMRDMLFAWDESALNSVVHHDIKATCMQDLNEDRLNAAAVNQELVEADLAFSTIESKTKPGTFFTDIKIWLPKEFLRQQEA